VTSKRRQSFPSETNVKRGPASFTAMSSYKKSSAATTYAHADRDEGFKRCCLKTGRFDGAVRDHYF
jgi:hypothetical protein